LLSPISSKLNFNDLNHFFIIAKRIYFGERVIKRFFLKKDSFDVKKLIGF